MLVMATLVVPSELKWPVSLYGLFLQEKILLVRLCLLLVAQAGHSNSVPKLLMMSECASPHNSIDNNHEQR